jgi:hypothetical protein
MSSIIFGYTMSLTTAATPSTGFLVAYDDDGILKQKDSAGVITPIGGTGSGSSGGTQSLAQVLSVSNDSETYSILMGTATSILVGNSGTIDMASASTIYMGTSSSILSNNGLSALYFDYNSLTSSVYLTTGYNYLSLTNATMSLVNSLGNTIDITNGSNYVKLSTDVDIFSNSEIRLRIFNTSDEILLKSNIGTSVTSTNTSSNAVFIGSQNSGFNSNVINSVIIGGIGQSAIANNSVYIPDTYIQDTKKLRGSLGDASLSFTDTNNLILENSNSLIALITSSSSTTLTTNGLIVTDTLTSFTSPAVDASPVLISTKNSFVDIGVHNAVILGGENLIASLTNSVVLGEYVNINNKYTLPNVDGASGSYMVTDGLGNLNWTSSPAEYQNLEDVLTLGNWTGYNSIEMGTGSSLYSVRGGGQINLDYAPDTVVISTDNGNLNKAYIQLDDEDIILVSNLSLNIGVGSASISVSNGEGLQYAFDYSSTFVTYSIVDKNYVDLGTASIWSTINSINNDFVSEVVAGDGLSGGGTSGTVTLDVNVGNGLQIISDQIYLGGTLSQNTLINGNNFDFKVEGANQISLTASNSTEYDYVFLGNGTTLGTTDGFNFSQLNSSITNISLFYQDSTGNNSVFEANTNGSFMYINNGLSQSIIQIYKSNQTIGLGDGSSNNTMIIEDEFSSKGLVYYDDYSANFTTYSLVTKGYVDSQVGTSTSKYATVASFTASVSQTITHSLGTDEVIVQTYDSSGFMIIGDVSISDSNSVAVRFTQNLSNIKIVIIG